MSRRVKLTLMGVLLLVALAITAVAAVNTIQAFKRFGQEHALVQSGDVRAIRPWMTIPFIAHTYHVPENYLSSRLHITDTQLLRHATLRTLADHSHKPINTLISTIQEAILTYRKQHPTGYPDSPPIAPDNYTTESWHPWRSQL